MFIQLSNIWMVLHPVAINTDEAIEYMKNELFLDPPHNNDLFLPLPAQPATFPLGFHQNLLPDNNKFIASMQCIKTGTASGLFAALTPSQCSRPNKEIMHPNLPLAHSFIDILHNAKLPNDVAFNASYFLAYFTKKIGLQPILIGIRLKQILGSYY